MPFLPPNQQCRSTEGTEELIQLCLIFLGGPEASAVSFRSSGAFHQERWMAKAIYCLKLYLFQDQFTMTTKERKGVTRWQKWHFSLAWFTPVFGMKLLVEFLHHWLNDVQLLEALDKYPSRVVAKAASESFGRHLWHFSVILVALSFNSSVRLCVEETWKFTQPIVLNMSRTLRYTENKCDFWCPVSKWSVESSEFSDEVPRGMAWWSRLQWAETCRISNEGCEWYCRERIAQMQQYNSSLTKNEEQKQFLLRLVERHRKTFPSSAKSTLMKMGNTDWTINYLLKHSLFRVETFHLCK